MIIEQIKSYLNWCKVNDLVPNEYKNLKTYCDMVQGAQASTYTYDKYVLKHE